MKKPIMLILSTFIVFMVAGCATIMKGSRQYAKISSQPSNATVYVDNQQMGQTPLTVKLQRKNDHLIKIEVPGYLSYEVKFTHKLNFWIFGNLVWGGVIGIVIDAVDGSMYSLNPKQVNADLKAGTAVTRKGNEELFLAVVLKADPRWQKIGQLQRIN